MSWSLPLLPLECTNGHVAGSISNVPVTDTYERLFRVRVDPAGFQHFTRIERDPGPLLNQFAFGVRRPSRGSGRSPGRARNCAC